MISNLATPLINKNKLVQDEINEDNKKNDRRQNQSNITDLENQNREIVDTVDDKIDYQVEKFNYRMEAPVSHVNHPLLYTTTKQKTFAYLKEKKLREEYYHNVYKPKVIQQQ